MQWARSQQILNPSRIATLSSNNIIGLAMGFVIMTALIPLFLNRIRMEEKLLTEEFGDAYKKYRETTKKLVPFVY